LNDAHSQSLRSPQYVHLQCGNGLLHVWLHSWSFIVISQLSCSGCPFPRSANKTIAIVIAIPAAAPNAVIPASAMKQLVQN